MKSVLISIKPKYCELIASGKKTIEVRKSRPNIETPFKCYIYMTQGKLKDLGTYSEWIYQNRMRVIGEFVCDEVYKWNYDYSDGVDIDDDLILDTCLEREDINIYANGKNLYGWHISSLKIYDKPKPLSSFYKPCPIEWKNCPCCEFYSTYTGCCMNCVKRPPESWCYVEEL